MTTHQPWTAQSLAKGAAGTALLHIERAHTGQGTWKQAHSWITKAVAGEVSAADTAGLYLGAPAIAFMLSAASTGSARYGSALKEVNAHVDALAHRRADAALTRIRRGDLATFHEYDVFSGLTGIGAHLLRSSPDGSAMEHLLRYLVELTKPLRVDGQELPGWWVGHDQHTRTSARYPGGHSNQSAAHGITGVLLLLSQAARRGVTVDGHHEAIETICAWLDSWQQHGQSGAWWPECVSLADLRTGRTAQSGPARPSWCYGTPGIARAQQLAAIATGDTKRRRTAEQHLADCLSDSVQLSRLTDAGLCHGWAGVYQTVWRADRDAATPVLRPVLPHLADQLVHHAVPSAADGPGFLEGSSGAALALMTAAQDTVPTSGWDACLLID
ncbi:lanthionine synthetase C family protein [Streptomyces sp. ET3-23]|uniref:lanthionine synthetase C family protein n=1 Tax=Streptomyces sp. ET3-23 TaxID=2885643 RepID=UPI001D0F6F4F|nr:lanthionine synthetase C family protein [Streptomyces sp. ET3-23]MCC2276170.1 lanthionine synthetase C family protein [Streptomyces sp. ET3-23]